MSKREIDRSTPSTAVKLDGRLIPWGFGGRIVRCSSSSLRTIVWYWQPHDELRVGGTRSLDYRNGGWRARVEKADNSTVVLAVRWSDAVMRGGAAGSLVESTLPRNFRPLLLAIGSGGE